MGIRNRIVECNMPLVLAMLRRFRSIEPNADALISDGSMALLRCVDTFDCSRGFKFSTYACRSILRSFSRVTRKAARHRCHFRTGFDPAMGQGDDLDWRRAEAESPDLHRVRKILAHNAAGLKR
jgi:RNA polymerase primary sigma factor